MKTKLQRSDRKTYKRYTPAERQKLVAEYRKSRLSQTAFCLKNDIILTTFSSWVKPYKTRKNAVAEFAELELSALAHADVSAEIVYPDGKVLRLHNFQMTEESATFLRRMASC